MAKQRNRYLDEMERGLSKQLSPRKNADAALRILRKGGVR